MNKAILILFALLTGCSLLPAKRHVAQSPSVEVSPVGAVAIKGDAQTAPKVDTSNSAAKMGVPTGSRIEFNEKLGTLAITLSKDSEIAVNRTETAIQGPVAFTPDKAPTIKEEKDAQSEYWIKLGLYAAVFIGGVAAVFGLVRMWNLVMWGGVATMAGGLFGLFVQRHPLILLLIGFGVALKFVGPILWHTTIKKLEPLK